MSFVLSKLLWGLCMPASLLLLCLLGGLLLWKLAPVLARGLVLLAAAFVAALLLAPLGQWAIRPLEQRFAEIAPPERVDGIIVLGGATGYDSEARGRVWINDAGERITSFVALARRYPDARLVFSGGSGAVRDQEHREALFTAPLLEAMGIPRERLILESGSRNTWENALYSYRLVRPQPGETWLLVTSAWHMPRSVGCFRKAGWQVVPYPVDYSGNDPAWWGFDAPRQLLALTLVEKEWIGLLAYHWMGRTDAVFPL